jgi:hypothetical protein
MSEKLVRYQWIKGENQGQVEEFVEEQGNFLKFKSGKRCNRSLIDEYIIEIHHDSQILSFSEDKVKTTDTPKIKSKESVVLQRTAQPQHKENPIVPILDKAKTKKTKLNIRIEMDLPSKEFLSVMEDSFDDNIIETLSDYITSKIEDPRDFIKNHISTALKDWYQKS